MLARCMPVLFGEVGCAPNGVAKWTAVLGALAKRGRPENTRSSSCRRFASLIVAHIVRLGFPCGVSRRGLHRFGPHECGLQGG